MKLPLKLPELDIHFQNCDYWDQKTIVTHAPLRRFIAGMPSLLPNLAGGALSIREILVRVLGLEMMQLIVGRTGQGYNQRGQYKGDFFEDSFQATLMERGEHFM